MHERVSIGNTQRRSLRFLLKTNDDISNPKSAKHSISKPQICVVGSRRSPRLNNPSLRRSPRFNNEPRDKRLKGCEAEKKENRVVSGEGFGGGMKKERKRKRVEVKTQENRVVLDAGFSGGRKNGVVEVKTKENSVILKNGEKRKRSGQELSKGWTNEQELALQRAHPSAKPSPHFWKNVSELVPGKSPQDCFDRIQCDQMTPPQTQLCRSRTNTMNSSPLIEFDTSATIGKPEHSECVRAIGIGVGVGIHDYVGAPLRRSGDLTVSQETLQLIEQEMYEQFRQEMYEQLQQDVLKETDKMIDDKIKSMQQWSLTKEVVNTGRVSTKGSCVAPKPLSNDRCELYVDEDPQRLVAIGIMCEGGLTIHEVPILPHWVRVVIEDVRDPTAQVPVPTIEVQLMGQTLNTFIAWPRHLIKVISTQKKDNIIRRRKVIIEGQLPSNDNGDTVEQNPIVDLLNISSSLMRTPVQMLFTNEVFGVDNTNVPTYITLPDILEIIAGDVMLNISVMQLWQSYLHDLSINQETTQIYGFLDPQSIQKVVTNKDSIQQYMQTWMNESGKQIFLAPYISGSHWQLIVLIPKDCIVVWFCSLHREPTIEMRQLLQGVIVGTNVLSGRGNQRKSIEFIIPKCNKQILSFECGYYVMYWMEVIIDATIMDSWIQVFQDVDPLINEIDILRNYWAAYLVQIKRDL